MKHSVKIYQLKRDEAIMNKFLFIRLSWLPNGIKDIDVNNYNCIYETEMNDAIHDKTDDILEGIYEIFNISRPADFHGHSLSVSDIVELNGVKYYVDSVGFEKL